MRRERKLLKDGEDHQDRDGGRCYTEKDGEGLKGRIVMGKCQREGSNKTRRELEGEKGNDDIQKGFANIRTR